MSGNQNDSRLDDFKNHIEERKLHKSDVEISKLRAEKNRFKKRYDQLLVDYEDLRSSVDFVKSMDLSEVGPITIEPLSVSPEEAVLFTICSDWHSLETVRPEQVNGLNKYDRGICEESVRKLFQESLDRYSIYSKRYDIPRIGIALLGDLITNMLHEDQKEMNDGTPTEEMLFVLDLVTGGIDFILKESDVERVTLFCDDGNHGRTTEKMRKSNRAKHSYEWLLYKFLERIYSDNPRVEFNISESYHLYADIFGKNARFHHGDYCRYNGGVGGLTIPMNKAIAEWDKALRAELDIFGHFHTFLWPGKFVSNGSLLGYSPYSVSIKAAFERPSQSIVLFNKKDWLLDVGKIYVR